MYLYCPKCSEPWEHTELRFHAEWDDVSVSTVLRTFLTEGCGEAFGTGRCVARCDALARSLADVEATLVEVVGNDALAEQVRRVLMLPKSLTHGPTV